MYIPVCEFDLHILFIVIARVHACTLDDSNRQWYVNRQFFNFLFYFPLLIQHSHYSLFNQSLHSLIEEDLHFFAVVVLSRIKLRAQFQGHSTVQCVNLVIG